MALYGVTVDDPNNAKAMKIRAKLSYEIISDPKGGLMDGFGLRHESGGPNGNDIPRPASILVDSTGKVLWRSVAENYRVRPKPDKVLAEVKEVLAGLSETESPSG